MFYNNELYDDPFDYDFCGYYDKNEDNEDDFSTAIDKVK